MVVEVAEGGSEGRIGCVTFVVVLTGCDKVVLAVCCKTCAFSVVGTDLVLDATVWTLGLHIPTGLSPTTEGPGGAVTDVVANDFGIELEMTGTWLCCVTPTAGIPS